MVVVVGRAALIAADGAGAQGAARCTVDDAVVEALQTLMVLMGALVDAAFVMLVREDAWYWLVQSEQMMDGPQPQ